MLDERLWGVLEGFEIHGGDPRVEGERKSQEIPIQRSLKMG